MCGNEHDIFDSEGGGKDGPSLSGTVYIQPMRNDAGMRK